MLTEMKCHRGAGTPGGTLYVTLIWRISSESSVRTSLAQVNVCSPELHGPGFPS